MADHAIEMLIVAERDLRALHGMTDRGVFSEQIFGFHAQQAIEKALKAWISSVGLEYPLIHNIARLLAILDEAGCEVQAYWILTEYTAYATALRYDVVDPTDEPLDREKAIREVQAIYDHVAALVGPE